MTTVWRPRVRVHVASDGDAGKEVGVEDVTKKGHEAEESPSNKRAMRARGEEALELRGVQWVSARSSAF